MIVGCCVNWAPSVYNGPPRWYNGKESVCQCKRCKKLGFDPRVGNIPWRKKWQPTAVFLPAKSRGQRCLVGCSSWPHKELDMTGRLSIEQQHL